MSPQGLMVHKEGRAGKKHTESWGCCSRQEQCLYGLGLGGRTVGALKCCLLHAEQEFPHPLAPKSAQLSSLTAWYLARMKDRTWAQYRYSSLRKWQLEEQEVSRNPEQEAHRENEKNRILSDIWWGWRGHAGC